MKPGSSSSSSNKIGDYNNHRPIIQGNTNSASSTAFKITQVGPVIGSNVIVSRMENNNVQRPNTSSPIPGNNFYFNPANNKPRPPSSTNNFYQNTANNVTKFTNMTVANAGAKNPLKPNHYTVPIPTTNSLGNSTTSNSNNNNSSNTTGNIVNLATHPNSNLSAPNTSGIAPKTTLKASDLIHILPNLFNTLKRRNSNSGTSGSTGNRSGSGGVLGSSGYFNNNNTNALAAAFVAAASNSGKPITTSTAAALVAEQLLNVAASGPFSDDSSPSPPPQQQQQLQPSKRIKLTGSALQCEICGKVYKHRNCLSKHMWEHHESWEHTKKSCQTKHQQVQLLEAAQVLSEIVSGVVKGNDRRNSNKNNSYSRNSDESELDENEEGDEDDDDGEIVTEEMNGMELVGEEEEEEEEENISIVGTE